MALKKQLTSYPKEKIKVLLSFLNAGFHLLFGSDDGTAAALFHLQQSAIQFGLSDFPLEFGEFGAGSQLRKRAQQFLAPLSLVEAQSQEIVCA